MDAIQAQATGLMAKLPPVVATQLQDDEFWTFYFPLGYVAVVPFLNLLIAALGACWKKIASMRKGSMLKRAATRKIKYNPKTGKYEA